MEPIEIIYDDKSATVPREASWLNAMVEPKEMLTRRMEKIVVAKMALSGISKPRET